MTDLLHRVERIEAQMDKSSTKKMTYRQLGDTGLRVSTVSLGCAPLGNVYGDLTDDEAKNIVHGAFERGINTFDTSPYYGNTTSETVLGRCLKDLPRDDIIVATKVSAPMSCGVLLLVHNPAVHPHSGPDVCRWDGTAMGLIFQGSE